MGGIVCHYGDLGTVIHCYPSIPFIATDNKESWSLCHLKASGSTARPCRFCEVLREDMHKYDRFFKLRDVEEIWSKRLDRKYLQSMSIHEDVIHNSFLKHWNVFGCAKEDFFAAFPVDMLHSMLAGVCRYTVAWTLSIVKVFALVSMGYNQLYAMHAEISRNSEQHN